MPSVRNLQYATAYVLTAFLAGLALAGCNQAAPGTNAAPPGALPPVAEGAPMVLAPAAAALPVAPPPPIGRVTDPTQGYAFADRAWAMSDAFADAPPDYTYDYGDDQPWVWRSGDDSECVVEAVPGGERYYYYEPGADTPFFVEDPEYGYGFENGVLVVVYDHAGRELPPDVEARQAEWAGRYLARARQLYQASRSAQHQAVAEANWVAQRDAIADQRAAWRQQQAQNADWRAYHEQYWPAEQAHWAPERRQRLAWAVQVDQDFHDQAHAQRDLAAAQNAQRSGAQLALAGPPPRPAPPNAPALDFGPAPQHGPPAGGLADRPPATQPRQALLAEQRQPSFQNTGDHTSAVHDAQPRAPFLTTRPPQTQSAPAQRSPETQRTVLRHSAPPAGFQAAGPPRDQLLAQRPISPPHVPPPMAGRQPEAHAFVVQRTQVQVRVQTPAQPVQPAAHAPAPHPPAPDKPKGDGPK